jgi:hypothetical protein
MAAARTVLETGRIGDFFALTHARRAPFPPVDDAEYDPAVEAAQWFRTAEAAARRFVRANPTLQVASRVVRNLVVVGPVQPVIVSYFQKKRKNAPPATTNDESFVEVTSEAAMTESLHRLGYTDGIKLKPEYVEELVAWTESSDYQRCNPHAHNALVYDLAHNATIIRLVRSYLGAEPVLHCTYLDWTTSKLDTGKEELDNATLFHYDAGDFRSCSVWFYMNDVDEQTAPHVVIGGTHKRKTIKDLFVPYIAADAAKERYKERIRMFVGPAGTGFIEDLSCIHKRATAIKPRLTLSLSYVLQRTPMIDNIPPGAEHRRPEEKKYRRAPGEARVGEG